MGLYALKREGRYKRELLGGQCTRITKRAKKKIKKGKKEIGWADNLSARFPPLASASEGGAFFYTPTSTRITPRSHLGFMPPRSRDSHPVLAILGISVRGCAPLGPPYPGGLALALPREKVGAFRYHNPTNINPVGDDLLSGRSLTYHVASCLRSHCL